MTRPLTLAAALAALVLLAGCGSSSKPKSTSSSSSAATSAPPTTSAGGAPTDLSHKPAIPQPTGPPPSKLVVKDLVKGTGPVAVPGKQVTVQYVGVDYATGKQFDSSWDRGQPFPFQLGAGQVIRGWDVGVAGMRVGGRRQLIIPPDQAYGAAGQPPIIGPNETLIFDVDLLKVQ